MSIVAAIKAKLSALFASIASLFRKDAPKAVAAVEAEAKAVEPKVEAEVAKAEAEVKAELPAVEAEAVKVEGEAKAEVEAVEKRL